MVITDLLTLSSLEILLLFCSTMYRRHFVQPLPAARCSRVRPYCMENGNDIYKVSCSGDTQPCR